MRPYLNAMLTIRSSKQVKVSRFEFNSSVKQLSRGESLLGSAQEKYGVWTGPRNCWFAALFEYHAKNPKLQGDKNCVTFRDK